jgi:hypothetical protein
MDSHTHGFFVPLLLATWLIHAQIQLSKLYWIPKRFVEIKRNGLVQRKPSRFHPLTFLVRGRGHLLSKALYMAEEKSEGAH